MYTSSERRVGKYYKMFGEKGIYFQGVGSLEFSPKKVRRTGYGKGNEK